MTVGRPQIGSLAKIDLRGIDWVIVGGESGSDARAMNIQWCARFSGRADEKKFLFFPTMLRRSEAHDWSMLGAGPTMIPQTA